MHFRKKPVVIEATRFPVEFPEATTPEYERAWNDLAKWCGGIAVDLNGETEAPLSPVIQITTLEGVMRADPGDWIIKGVKGEFYPCKPDVFAESYEAVIPAKD